MDTAEAVAMTVANRQQRSIGCDAAMDSQSSQSFDEELSSFNSELPLEFLSSFVKFVNFSNKNMYICLINDFVSLFM